MASHDLISRSLKLAWLANPALMSAANIYFGRAQQPAGLAGFPYASMTIEQTGYEAVTRPGARLVTYLVQVEVYTTQGQTGGVSSGDQVTDQGNLMRAFCAILNNITPNTAWFFVAGFKHCIQNPGAACTKEEALYLGSDVYKSTQSWTLLTQED